MTTTVAVPDTLPTHLRHSPSCRVGAALWGGLAVVDVGTVTGAPPTVTVLGLAALVAACSRHQGALTAVLVAAVAWLVLDGFVSGRLGQLQVSGANDLVPAAVLVVAALAGSEVAR